MIDTDGFRANVGIILTNIRGQVFWAKRIGQDAWQFPQGGLHPGERPEEGLFRELQEEVGLRQKDVCILGRTRDWLRYRLPKPVRRDSQPLCVGQKQLWYLLQLQSSDDKIVLTHTNKPEFDGWQWANYWYPLRFVISFKREVYRRALLELSPIWGHHLPTTDLR